MNWSAATNINDCFHSYNWNGNQSFMYQNNNNNWSACTGPTTISNNVNFRTFSQRPNGLSDQFSNCEMNLDRQRINYSHSISGPSEMGYRHENQSMAMNPSFNNSYWSGYMGAPTNNDTNSFGIDSQRSNFSQARSSGPPEMGYRYENQSMAMNPSFNSSYLSGYMGAPTNNDNNSFGIDSQRINYSQARSLGPSEMGYRYNFNRDQSNMDQGTNLVAYNVAYNHNGTSYKRPLSDPFVIYEMDSRRLIHSEAQSSAGPSEYQRYNEMNWSELIMNTDEQMGTYATEVENNLNEAVRNIGANTSVDSNGKDQNNASDVQVSCSGGFTEKTVSNAKIVESNIQINSKALETIPETQRSKNVITSKQPGPINRLSYQSGSCDNSDMYVPTSDKKGKKLWCPYCLEKVSKFARHVEARHKSETDVKALLDLPKRSPERRQIQDYLRKSATLKWNTSKELNKGELIVSRRPNQKLNKKASDYITCSSCSGSYTRNGVRKHAAKCHKKRIKGEHVTTKSGRAAEGRLHTKASPRLRRIFPVMREDEIVRLIKFDWLLILYGNQICIKHSKDYQEDLVRRLLRFAGRLLNEIKKINAAVTDFASIYNPAFYDSMIEAIGILAGLDPITNTWATPANATSAITQIKQIGTVLKSQYIKDGEPENQKITELFLYLMENEANITVCKTARETQATMRRNKKPKIPSTEDVKRFAQYLDRERKISYTELNANFTYDNWLKLSEFTMVSIIVFNRRRTGETQNILVSDFLNRESINEMSNNQLFDALTDEAKKIVQKYSRMAIRGKRGRAVHVLVKPDIVECITLLLFHRTAAGISADHKYLFAKPTSSDYQIKVVRACEVLAKLAGKCGADDPSTLGGTNMRKHVATMCATMGLSDEVVSEIADFMGHHERVHRDYYRHNTLEREVVNMSQILQAAKGYEDSDSDSSESDIDLDEIIMSQETEVNHIVPKRKRRVKTSNSGKVTVAKGCGSKPTRKQKKKTCSDVVIQRIPKGNTPRDEMELENRNVKKRFAGTINAAKSAGSKLVLKQKKKQISPSTVVVKGAVSSTIADHKVARQRKANSKYSSGGDYVL